MGCLRLAEPGRGHEQPAARASRRRRRHEPDLPELGPGALDRHLLQPHDHRPRRGRCRRACPTACCSRACRAAVAARVADLPPVSTLFAAFLGYNPMQHLLGAATLAQPRCRAGRDAHRAPLLPAISSPRRSRRACTPPSTSPSSPAWSRPRPRGPAAGATCTNPSPRPREPAAGAGSRGSATLHRDARR